MTFTQEIIDVFDNELIQEPCILVHEFKFYLGKIPTSIVVKIYHALYLPEGTGPYEFEISHYIRTPLQGGSYIPSSPYASTPAFALRDAISTLTRDYRNAITAGHEPSEDWLEPRS